MKINDFNLIAVVNLLCLTFFNCSSTNIVGNKQNNRKYLILSDLVKVENTNERHIEVIQNNLENSEFVTDDRVAFSKKDLNYKERINFLAEYLSFYGDTTLSNKSFSNFYGRSANRLEIAKKKIRYPVEVEALYSMTTMLFNGSIIVSPVLINKNTGEICNFKRRHIAEVYKIYRKWFKEIKNNNVSKLSWPLKGSEFEWLGEDTIDAIEPLLKQSI